jgi:hypothetical protein
MINNPTSKEIVDQLPLENPIIFNSDGLLSIPLKTRINIDISKSISTLVKGNILSDGDYLFIYYGENKINTQPNNFILAGNVNNIDDFVLTINNHPSFNLGFRLLCKSSFIMKENVNISISNPSFRLFHKDSLYFEDIPNLYFGSNNEPLYSYCELNKDIPYEITCKFNEGEIKKYFFLYPGKLNVYEIIPGCNFKIDVGLSIYFQFEIKDCKEYDENNKCKKCGYNHKYKVSEDGQECKYSSYFYYMIIGVPLIDFTLILLMIFIKCLKKEKLSNFLIFTFGFFVFINLVSIIPFYAA